MPNHIEDTVIAIDMDGQMRVRLAEWTPTWAYDALHARLLDSRSIDLSNITDGERLGTARLNTDDEYIEWFIPR
jgi:hypothetical protein